MSKRSKAAAPTDDELGELFSGIDTTTNPAAAKKSLDAGGRKPGNSKPTSTAAKAIADQDILAELENELSASTPHLPPSRPHTPKVRKGSATAATPPLGAGAEAGEAKVPRKSTESARSLRASFTPSATSSDLHESERKAPVAAAAAASGSGAASGSDAQASGGGGGWWGSIFTTASAAMKTAETTVKNFQHTEEAKKWAEQVRGNVGVLKGFGDELRHRALPTFTDILHTLAPPISSHERLHIHITHDLVGYPSLDPLIHDVFARVMSQVEGGDLLVIQRGHESSAHSSTSRNDAAGWRDGPWWRSADPARDMSVVKGLTEGTKLCRASAEGYASEYFSSRGGIEGARVRATEPLSRDNPVRTSDLFLSVQAVGYDADTGLFAHSSSVEREKQEADVQEPEAADEMVCFAVFILDPVHEIEYSALSQGVPARWVKWMDASATSSIPTPTSGAGDEAETEGEGHGAERGSEGYGTPEEIQEIIEAGGVDPREWVAEWLEESLSLSVGVVAQRYVARRMGVGEGGIGRGKRRMEEIVQDGAGEVARAGLI